MTDIVERLTKYAVSSKDGNLRGPALDAADEITRLQNEKDEALNQLDSALHSVDVLEKRNAQLLAKMAKADALAELGAVVVDLDKRLMLAYEMQENCEDSVDNILWGILRDWPTIRPAALHGRKNDE